MNMLTSTERVGGNLSAHLCSQIDVDIANRELDVWFDNWLATSKLNAGTIVNKNNMIFNIFYLHSFYSQEVGGEVFFGYQYRHLACAYSMQQLSVEASSRSHQLKEHEVI